MTAVAAVAAVAAVGRTPASWVVGVRAALPFAVAYVPFGLAIGAYADRAAVDDLLGWSTAWLLYAGTAQLALLQLLEAGAAPVVVIATVALINLRLVAYATALSPDWRTAPRRWTALASYLLVDPSYVIAAARRGRGPDQRWRRGFYLGAATALWANWLLVCGAGVLLGDRMATLVPTDLLAELMLVAMVALLAGDRGTRIAAGVGFGLGIPAVLLPAGAGALLVAVVAVLVTMQVERWSR